jgi:Domain of unknown function (DUF4375)
MADHRVKRPKSDDDLIEAIFEPLMTAYVEAREEDETAAKKLLAALTPGQRLMCAYAAYNDDVTNGGHAQYFNNYTGNLWRDALAATKAFGLAEEHEILKAAVALFPKKTPADGEEARQAQLENIEDDKFNDLDERYYDAPASRDKLVAYVKNHADEFFLPGKS